MLRDWDKLPTWMKCPEVKEYYDILEKRKLSLKVKRIFDITVASVLLIVLAIPMVVVAMMIKLDSQGPVFFRQERVTSYGKKDKIGSAVTVDGDNRITKIGSKLRNLRLDELPQLLDVLSGNMSFVGTRPESTKYVKKYSKEMRATLLLPAGITSDASIRYKDEAKLLDKADDIDKVYIEKVLPEKMKYNLESIREFNFFKEIVTMLRTVLAVVGKEYR